MKKILALVIAILLVAAPMALSLGATWVNAAAEDEIAEEVAVEAEAAEEAVMEEPAFEPLQQGSGGEAVVALQTALQALGYEPGRADGIFGAKTENAVKAYQTAMGLVEDGVVTESLYNDIIAAGEIASMEKVPLVDFAVDSRLEATTDNTGVTYTPNADGSYVLSGSAQKAAVIGLIPQSLPATSEEIYGMEDILTLEAGKKYLVSGVQLVCTTQDTAAGLIFINTCEANRTVADALVYEPTEELHVKEIRVWHGEGTASEGSYEPFIAALQ